MGKMVEVSIYEAGKHFMKGQPVSDGRVYAASITRPLAKGEVSGLTEVSKDIFSFTTLVKQQLFKHNDSMLCMRYHFIVPFLDKHEALIFPDRLKSGFKRCFYGCP